MPRAQLFEVDGIKPPQRISKLSLRISRSIATLKAEDNKPPRSRPPIGRAIVNQNHPAATATAAAAAAAREVLAGKTNDGGIISAPASCESPLRHAKTLANEKISEMCHHNPRAAIAVEAPNNAQATAGVTVDFPAISQQSRQSNPPDRRVRR